MSSAVVLATAARGLRHGSLQRAVSAYGTSFFTSPLVEQQHSCEQERLLSSSGACYITDRGSSPPAVPPPLRAPYSLPAPSSLEEPEQAAPAIGPNAAVGGGRGQGQRPHLLLERGNG